MQRGNIWFQIHHITVAIVLLHHTQGAEAQILLKNNVVLLCSRLQVIYTEYIFLKKNNLFHPFHIDE